MLAVQLLVAERPSLASTAVNLALGTASDPATVSRLLQLLEFTDQKAIVIAKCKETLGRLATSEYLVIRALARRLLGSEAPPMPPPSPADPALLADSLGNLWTPNDRSPD